jgi:hypothetical protein
MVHVFGECELDEELFELRRRGKVVKIEPKVFNGLAYLLGHRERVASKDELLDALWPDQVVSESVLPKCVAFENAAAIARRLGRVDLLARAAVGYRGPAEMGTPPENTTLALLESKCGYACAVTRGCSCCATPAATAHGGAILRGSLTQTC